MKTVGVHLGAHKTATTHLQMGLAAVASAARAEGLLIQTAPATRRPPTDWHALSLKGDAADWGRAAAAMADRCAGVDRLLLSEELILGDLTRGRFFGAGGVIYPRAAQRLAQVLAAIGGPPATLFLSIRRPDSFLTSAFAENLRTGRALLLADYLDGFAVPALRWSELIARLAALPGVGEIVVWRYENLAALRPAILARMLGSGLAAQVTDSGPQREGVSRRAYRAILAALPTTPAEERRAMIADAMARFPKGPRQPGLDPLHSRIKAASAAAYDRDCALIARMDRVTLLEPGADPGSPVAAGLKQRRDGVI